MTNNEIIEKIYRDGILKQIVLSYVKDKSDLQFADDLEQDIYIQLLEMNNERLCFLYNSGQLRYYLTGVVSNNIRSKTSPFHYHYRKPLQHEEINNLKI